MFLLLDMQSKTIGEEGERVFHEIGVNTVIVIMIWDGVNIAKIPAAVPVALPTVTYVAFNWLEKTRRIAASSKMESFADWRKLCKVSARRRLKLSPLRSRRLTICRDTH